MVRRLDWGKASLPYDPDTQGGGYGHDKVNLKFSRSQFEKMIPPGDHTLFLAAGAASERVFFNIVRKDGEQIIPAIFSELKKRNKGTINRAEFDRIIKSLTGEDLSDFYPSR